MQSILEIESIFIYSEENDKSFYTTFSDKLNVIYGRNTSGKSTVIRLILYTFGINDNKVKLANILSEEIFVRIDCKIKVGSQIEKYVFLRQNETLFVQEPTGRVVKFNGIGADQSNEHVKLKYYFKELFNFNLQLESKTGVDQAPIETLFLPYYISQDVGWVYLRKSFSNLEFYKNFKEDFLDYYLGIESPTDREYKRKIENEIRRIQQQISFFTNVERDNEELEVAKITDDALSGKANEFISKLSEQKSSILSLENEYVKEANKLTFYNERWSVVSKVLRSHKKQIPGEDSCPTCSQILPSEIEQVYAHYQMENDSLKLKAELNDKITKTQSRINSLNKKINEARKAIDKSTSIFNSYSEEHVTLDSWISNKAKIQLFSDVMSQIGSLTKEMSDKKEELEKYKTDSEIIFERAKRNSLFQNIFLQFNRELGVPEIEEDRFSKVYEISGFPFQGAELHLAVISYYFAFNRLLTKNLDIHRLPFMLDSIFEGDLDGTSRSNILDFIYKHHPIDTQCILSISDSKKVDSRIADYTKKHLKEKAHLICIGEGTKQKAILSENNGQYAEMIEDSYTIMETV